ncbi:hypothetical protein GF386_01065 [Candidatus Pacearchaeota archaeon]|nr:hypothetical protein [Candidatus Pacearchaeota archaeon]MBD3282822.1 hypothetical protein [Candidatus Pacearchaeota archaeon]
MSHNKDKKEFIMKFVKKQRKKLRRKRWKRMFWEFLEGEKTPEKPRASVRGWIISARKRGISLDLLDSDKTADMERLQKMRSSIPVYDSYCCDYSEFSRWNRDLMRFLKKYGGFVVRAIPIPERTDLPRRPITGMLSYSDCRWFLEREEIVQKNKRNYRVVVSEWEPEEYAGILILGADSGKRVTGEQPRRLIRGEIGKNLTRLSFGWEIPLAGFEIDRGKTGRIEDKTKWNSSDNHARELLWRAYKFVCNDDGFSPYLDKPSYFEFVVTCYGEKIRFVDYKDVRGYLS